MEDLKFRGKIIPPSFVKLAISKGLLSVGKYDGAKHEFERPLVSFSKSEDRKIIEGKAIEDKLIEVSDTEDSLNELLRTIRGNLPLKPPTVNPHRLSKDNCHVYQRIVIIEEDKSETDLVYLGNQYFMVFKSTKAALVRGARIRCISPDVSVGEKVKFKVFIEDKEFTPPGDYVCPPVFTTKKIVQIKVYGIPELYSIIDDSEKFGGRINAHGVDPASDWFDLYSKISKKVEELNNVLPIGEKFPEYDELLKDSMSKGVSSYILNYLIETIEERVPKEQPYKADEWEKSQAQLDHEKKEENSKALECHRKIEQEFGDRLKELDRLKQRQVLLIFKAAAKVDENTDKAIRDRIKELEDDIENAKEKGYEGFKSVDWNNEYEKAKKELKRNTAPDSRENLKAGAILAAVVVVALFVLITWTMSSASSKRYHEGETTIMAQIETSKDYDGLSSKLDTCFLKYKPAYTRFTIRRSYKKNLSVIAEAKETEVVKLVEGINAMLKANRGRFNRYSEEALFKLLEVAPDDPRAIELKEKYKKN